MAKQVAVPQGALMALCAVAVLALVGLGFMWGKQANQPSSVSALPTTPPTVEKAAKPNLDDRLSALEGRVTTLRQREDGQSHLSQANTSPAIKIPPSAPVPKVDAEKAYLEQVDTILGKSAFASPQPFASRLLDQGMQNDAKSLDSVLSQTRQAKKSLEAVKPPSSCLDHHRLSLRQLDHAIALLEKVKAALTSGDTAALETVQANDDSHSSALKLSELDADLRKGQVPEK